LHFCTTSTRVAKYRYALTSDVVEEVVVAEEEALEHNAHVALAVVANRIQLC
jgi:hypothetical protein